MEQKIMMKIFFKRKINGELMLQTMQNTDKNQTNSGIESETKYWTFLNVYEIECTLQRRS